MAQEEQRRPAARTGTWGLGFGIALAALALVAGWYVPSPRAPATSTPTPSVVSGPTSTTWPAASTPLPQFPTTTLVVPTAAPTGSAAAAASPTPVVTVYIVQPGETLSEIATKLGVPQQAIIDANGLAAPDRLADGQRLVIPKAADER